MIITLSPGFMRDKPTPELFVQHCAASLGLHFRVKWANARSVRGVLVAHLGSYRHATDAEHDAFIADIFRLDSEAYVRTALAVYSGADEFNNWLPLVK